MTRAIVSIFIIATITITLVQSTYAQALEPNLSGIKIGYPISYSQNIAATRSHISREGPFTMNKWVFSDGNELSVTVSPKGLVVYAESDWGGNQVGAISDFPSFNFGQTTLAQIRAKLGSNGFAFSERAPISKIRDGILNLNSYEVGKVVVTFYTKLSFSKYKSLSTPSEVAFNASLDAISISDPEYADALWGRRIFDPGYHPIDWE